MWRIIALVIVFELAYCKGDDALYDPPGGKGFWAQKITPGSTVFEFYRVAAMYVAGSKNTSIYLDTAPRPNGLPDVDQASIDRLLTVFENQIIPIEHTWYTAPLDVNQDGKVLLLLLDIQDGYRVGSASGYVGGYFFGLNQYSENSVNTYNSNYHSNYAEMLYLDTYPSDYNSTGFYATAAHEYQHLLQFSKSYREGIALEPAWIDEGLAEISSDLTGFGPQYSRASYFTYSLLNSTSLLNFQSVNGSSLLDNYSMVYMYFRYLADVYGLGGISTIFNESRLGYDGINQSLAVLDPTLTGVSNCGSTTGLTNLFFQCSYRYFWATLVNTLGATISGTKVLFNNSTVNTLTPPSNIYLFNTSNTAYRDTVIAALNSGNYGTPLSPGVGGTPTGSLPSFGVKLFQSVVTGPPDPAPTLTSCNGCGLTMVAGSKYLAVYNHDLASTATHFANVADSRLVASMNADSTVLIDQLPTLSGSATRQLHARFEIAEPFHAHLRKHATEDRKKAQLKRE